MTVKLIQELDPSEISYRRVEPRDARYILDNLYFYSPEDGACIEDLEELLSPNGMNAQGLFLLYRDKPAAYAVMYNLERELELQARGQLKGVFQEYAESLPADNLKRNIKREYRGFNGNVWHHYDVGVRPEFRGYNLGSKVVRQMMEQLLPRNDISVGFDDIEDDNIDESGNDLGMSALMTSAKSGMVLDKLQLAYGEHENAREVYSHRFRKTLEQPVERTTGNKEDILSMIRQGHKVVWDPEKGLYTATVEYV